jgi:hypothetical protein
MLPVGTAAAFTLCLVQCSAEQPGDTADEPNLGSVSQALEHCGNKACSSQIDCTVSMPVCALTAGATCYNNAECTYKLNTGSSCPCIERLGESQLFLCRAGSIAEQPLDVLTEAAKAQVDVRGRTQRRQQPAALHRIRRRPLFGQPRQRFVRLHPLRLTAFDPARP